MVVNADFPFQSKYLNIDGSKIHYIEEGNGENPVLFLHGNPTSSYLWRNIIPIVAQDGGNNRCIALDLIGFGKSDKPDIDYNFQDHYKYVKEFIARLGLENNNNNNNLIIVGHDWGGVLGFWYAFNHQENIKGIAFMETFPFTLSIDDFPAEFAKLIQAFRSKGSGYELLQVQNVFVEQVLPAAVFNNKQNMSESIMNHYREPFPTVESRKPIRRFPEMLPLDPQIESEVYMIIQKLEAALPTFKFPRLLIKGNPGAVISESRAKWLKERMPDLVIKDIGPGIHYLQEDNPQLIGNSILEWSSKLT